MVSSKETQRNKKVSQERELTFKKETKSCLEEQGEKRWALETADKKLPSRIHEKNKSCSVKLRVFVFRSKWNDSNNNTYRRF